MQNSDALVCLRMNASVVCKKVASVFCVECAATLCLPYSVRIVQRVQMQSLDASEIYSRV